MISFLPSMQRKLRRDGLHLFNIRYWDNVLPSIVPLGTSLLVRYDPRNLSKVYVAGPDRLYHPIPYADLALPPITLWEHRAAVSALREQGEQTPTQASIFQAVCAQRDLIERAAAKTKTARRQSQRNKNAASGTTGSSSSSKEAVDYSLPVTPADVEIWDH
jgi:putative transposase